MIVLGIDPGTAAMGYGVVDRSGGRLRAVDYGCITTTADQPLPERLQHLHEHVAELIETHRPDIVAVVAEGKHRPAVGGVERDDLGRVHRGAATDRHDDGPG